MSNLERDLLFWRIFATFVVVCAIAVGIAMFRSFRRKPSQKFSLVYDGLKVHALPLPDFVSFSFRTYDGFLAWVTQTNHRGYATAQDARELLRRLHRYNLTRGLFCYGALFVPLLSYLNYRSQLKAIDKQLVQLVKPTTLQ